MIELNIVLEFIRMLITLMVSLFVNLKKSEMERIQERRNA